MRPYLGNRIGLTVTGLVLAGAGAYGVLRGLGEIPGQAAGAPVLDPGLPARLAEDPGAGWLAALVLVVLGLVSVRWLLRSLGWGRRGRRSETGIAMLGVALKEVEGLSRVRVRTVEGDGSGSGCAAGPRPTSASS
ncbi:hypothetical protein [Planomonospora algeriensis]